MQDKSIKKGSKQTSTHIQTFCKISFMYMQRFFHNVTLKLEKTHFEKINFKDKQVLKL